MTLPEKALLISRIALATAIFAVGSMIAAFAWSAPPIAFQPCGAHRQDKAPCGNPIRDYHEWAKVAGPILEAGGYTRLMFHNPGGTFALGWQPEAAKPESLEKIAQGFGLDTRTMLPNQWPLAKQCRAPFADDDKLKAAHDLLTSKHKLTEIIYYLGDPTMLEDPYSDGLASVKAFTRLGKKASLGFDLLGLDELGASDERLLEAARLCEKLQSMGHRVYVEPRPYKPRVPWQSHSNGSIARARQDRNQPEAFAAAEKFGEVLRISEPPGSSFGTDAEMPTWPSGVTRIVRDWQKIKAASVMGGE